MRRAPAFLVALTAALTELIILAAAGNQWTVDHLTRHPPATELPRDHVLKAALTSFGWRFMPESHARMIWLGGIVAAAGLVVAVLLLVWVFVGPMRAPRSFVAVFLGTWGLVVAVTQIAAIAQPLLAYGDLFPNGHDPSGFGRFWYSVFEGPSSVTVLFGGASGLVVALVAAIFASVSNRAAAEPDEMIGAPTTAPDAGSAWQAREPASTWNQPDDRAGPTDETATWPPPAEETTRSWSSPTTTSTTSEYRWGSPGDAESPDAESADRTMSFPRDSADKTVSFPRDAERTLEQRSNEPPSNP